MRDTNITIANLKTRLLAFIKQLKPDLDDNTLKNEQMLIESQQTQNDIILFIADFFTHYSTLMTSSKNLKNKRDLETFFEKNNLSVKPKSNIRLTNKRKR